MIKIAATVVIVVVVSVSVVVIQEKSLTHSLGYDSSGVLVDKIVGDVSNPHSYYNTSYGYVTPNLWNLQKGDGNVTMNVYSNSSILTTSNLSNVSIGYGGVIGYPSEHFTSIIGNSVQYMIDSNFSSFTSFKIASHTPNIAIDMAYDIFLAQGNRLTDEIMIYLYKANYNIGMLPFDNFYSSAIVDGNSRNISWNVYESASTPWWGQMYAFIPSTAFNNSMSYKINFSPFFKYLVDNKYILGNLSIARCGIGSEFSYQMVLENNHIENLADYSFWMYSYFILDGKDCQICTYCLQDT